MKVVAHQAVRMHLPAGLLTGLRQRLQQSFPVLVILENGLSDSSHDRLPQDIECALSEPCAEVNPIIHAGSTKYYNLIN